MKTLSYIIICMLITMPSIALAQQTEDAANAIADAQRDAKLANTTIWGGAGCFLGVLGILLAAFIPPTVPPVRLLGKSPEYVVYYTSTYQNNVKTKQTTSAAVGCLIGSCTGGIIWVAVAASN